MHSGCDLSVRCSYVKGKASGDVSLSEGKCIDPEKLNMEESMEMSFLSHAL